MATLTRLIASAQELAELQSSLHYADHVLNETRIRFTSNSDMTKAISTHNNDSPKNWYISWLRDEPMVLCIPTSRARFSEGFS